MGAGENTSEVGRCAVSYKYYDTLRGNFEGVLREIFLATRCTINVMVHGVSLGGVSARQVP